MKGERILGVSYYSSHVVSTVGGDTTDIFHRGHHLLLPTHHCSYGWLVMDAIFELSYTDAAGQMVLASEI